MAHALWKNVDRLLIYGFGVKSEEINKIFRLNSRKTGPLLSSRYPPKRNLSPIHEIYSSKKVFFPRLGVLLPESWNLLFSLCFGEGNDTRRNQGPYVYGLESDDHKGHTRHYPGELYGDPTPVSEGRKSYRSSGLIPARQKSRRLRRLWLLE